MAVKCLVTFTIISLLGIVCARELKLTSKLKADPGIFISLETLRRLEAKVKKNGTEGITTVTPSENSVDDDNSDDSTTSNQDIDNNTVSNYTDEPDETTISDIENQTNQPTSSKNTKTDGSLEVPVTSVPNHPDINQQHYPNQFTSQQALLAYQKINWPVQYPYNWANQNYYQPNPYQQLPNGAATNQQNIGYHQMNPVLFNQRILYHYNDPQPFSVNPQITFDPNQHYQQTFIVQHPYPINHPSNPQMN